MKAKLKQLKETEAEVLAAPDQQISLTDPDARAMATSMRGSGVVGYNVQTAVDPEHHLIVAHEVTNIVDRTLLSPMARQASPRVGQQHRRETTFFKLEPDSPQCTRCIKNGFVLRYMASNKD